MEQEIEGLVRIAICDKHGEYEEVQRERNGPGRDEFGNAKVVKFMKWEGHCSECAAETLRRAEQLKAKIEHYDLQQRVRASGIPSGFREKTLGNYEVSNPGQQHAWDVANSYASAFDEIHGTGRNLIFTGKPGCGKTHLAIAIGIALMEMKFSVRYTTVGDMVRRFTDTWGRHAGPSEIEVLADLTGADLLILDEAGVQSGSDVELRTIFNVIDGRYREKLPTLVVSNMSIKNLTPYLGERVIDRLRDYGSVLVAFGWESHRGKKGVRNAA